MHTRVRTQVSGLVTGEEGSEVTLRLVRDTWVPVCFDLAHEICYRSLFSLSLPLSRPISFQSK